MRLARPVLLAAALTLTAAAAAPAATYDVPAQLGDTLARVAARTDVPVRLPRRVDLDFDGGTYASGFGRKGAYGLSLAGAPKCANATACSLAEFDGERGGTPAFRRTVALRDGRVGFYKPLSCGGSCSPPMLQWKQRGVLYTIQANIDAHGARATRAAMIKAANSAIAARPR